jgi:hypothetical protein
MTARCLSIQSKSSLSSLPGEHLSADGQLIAGQVQTRVEGVSVQQPPDVGAAANGLPGSDAGLLHQVLLSVGRGHAHRRAEPLDARARVAFVPRVRQHDHCNCRMAECSRL